MTPPLPSRPPCDCGNPKTSWWGDRQGHRILCCQTCYLAYHRPDKLEDYIPIEFSDRLTPP